MYRVLFILAGVHDFVSEFERDRKDDFLSNITIRHGMGSYQFIDTFVGLGKHPKFKYDAAVQKPGAKSGEKVPLLDRFGVTRIRNLIIRRRIWLDDFCV